MTEIAGRFHELLELSRFSFLIQMLSYMCDSHVVRYQGLHVIQLSLGTSHSAAVVGDGRVFTWGYGGDGRLGHGGEEDVLYPRVISSLEGVEVVMAGAEESPRSAPASQPARRWALSV